MPFTPAHPAILLPLKKAGSLPLSWTALLIGSVIPDFEYFIWMSPAASVSHTLWGIFSFNLPLTLLMSYLWHRLLGPALLPRLQFFRDNIYLEKHEDFFEWLKVNWRIFLLSSLIGIVSHLAWDSFCHANGYMVHRIPYLLSHAYIGRWEVRRCYILWYLSTLAGLFAMIFHYISFKKLTSASAWQTLYRGRSFLGKILFVAIILATLRISAGLSWNWLRHLVVITIGSLFYATILVCYFERRIQEMSKAGAGIHLKM